MTLLYPQRPPFPPILSGTAFLTLYCQQVSHFLGFFPWPETSSPVTPMFLAVRTLT